MSRPIQRDPRASSGRTSPCRWPTRRTDTFPPTVAGARPEPCGRRTAWLLAAAILCPATACALPPATSWEQGEGAFRLLLGSFDADENSRLLHNDSHRYAVGLSASAPVAWDDRLEADLEIWVNGRGYPAASTAAGSATDTLSYEAAALTYGLRAHTLTTLRPYALITVGFQASRLQARTLATPAVTVKEENLVPSAQIGLGVEWQVGHDLFSLNWRRWYAEGDFTEFGARGLSLGGDFFGIGLGHRW